jgi:hypothetical protein
MVVAHPTDEVIRGASRVILLDSERNYYESVGEMRIDRDNCGTVLRPVHHLTIIVNSSDLAELERWRARIAHLRLPDIAD